MLFLIITGISCEDLHPVINWKFPTGGRITAPPAVGTDGNILFTSEDRYLYSVNKEGELQWRFFLDEKPSDSLSVGCDGTIYTGTTKNGLVSVNISGRAIWKIKLKGSPVGSPAVDPAGNIYAVTDEGYLYSISHTGFIRWEAMIPSKPVMTVSGGELLFTGTEDNRIHAFSKDGVEEWVFLLSGKLKSIAVGSDYILAGTDNSTVVLISTSGKKIWNKKLYGPVNSINIIDDESFIAASGNRINMLDLSGEIIWEKSYQSEIYNTALSGDYIINIDSKGNLEWIDFEGRWYGNVSSGKSLRPFSTDKEGSVYNGSSDWILYKASLADTEASSYRKYIWSKSGRDSRNSGWQDKTGNYIPDIRSSSSEMDYYYLKELSESNDQKMLSLLLDNIEEKLIDRKGGYYKGELIDLLEYAASDCIKRPIYDQGRIINDFPLIRSRAVALLGIFGDLDTRLFLKDLLFSEWDSYVSLAIIRSLGSLGSNYNGISGEALAGYYNRNRERLGNRELAELLSAVSGIIAYSGIADETLTGLVLEVFRFSGSKNIKEQALGILNSLKK